MNPGSWVTIHAATVAAYFAIPFQTNGTLF